MALSRRIHAPPSYAPWAQPTPLNSIRPEDGGPAMYKGLRRPAVLAQHSTPPCRPLYTASRPPESLIPSSLPSQTLPHLLIQSYTLRLIPLFTTHMSRNQTPYTPGAPYVQPAHGLPTPPSGQYGQYQYSSATPNAPYMAPVPLPRTPLSGSSYLPSPPESPNAPRHAPPALSEYIARGRISYDVRAPPVTAVHPDYLGQVASDRSFTMYIPALGNALGVSYVSIPSHGFVAVHTVLDCLNRHLLQPISAQVLSSLPRDQRAAMESVRLRERGSGSPLILRDLLHANVYFKGLEVQGSNIVAHLSSRP
ncbi:hypothetical protein PENSPDRAFT_749423 [Peniophora sp. CONT]|nr:hypothetical protein PENSPDRAFT_749423 [Peniophora sp. CONT]